MSHCIRLVSSRFHSLTIPERVEDVKCTHEVIYILTELGNVYYIGTCRKIRLTLQKMDYFQNNCTSIKCGAYHCWAMKNDGKIVSWGNGNFEDHHQLCRPTVNNENEPEEIYLPPELKENWHELDIDYYLGHDHAFIVTNQGTVYGVGDNTFCQLGISSNGYDIPCLTKIHALNPYRIRRIWTGFADHSVAETIDGRLLALGKWRPQISRSPQYVTEITNRFFASIRCIAFNYRGSIFVSALTGKAKGYGNILRPEERKMVKGGFFDLPPIIFNVGGDSHFVNFCDDDNFHIIRRFARTHPFSDTKISSFLNPIEDTWENNLEGVITFNNAACLGNRFVLFHSNHRLNGTPVSDYRREIKNMWNEKEDGIIN